MEKLLCVAVLALLCGTIVGDPTDYTNVKPPQVYVYSSKPVRMGEENELICHCNNFHPPRITLKLKKEGKEIPDCKQTDMTFNENWAYYVTRFVKFTPQPGEEYTCEVQHNDGSVKSVMLDSLM